MKTCKEEFSVKTYETDHNGFFRPISFLNHAQEMSNIHAQSLGFGYDNLLSSGVIWVLSRIHIKFRKLPEWKDKLSIETWHKGSDRLFGFRDFSVLDSTGEEIIAATSSWLIIDYQTRRLQRIGTVLGSDFKDENKRDAIMEHADRLLSPANMALTYSHTVSVSDLDINGHTNNAKYFEWALDALPFDVTRDLKINEMWINFNNESLPGDKIDLYTSMDSNLFVEGKRKDTSVFQLKIK